MIIRRNKIILNLSDTQREKSQDWTGLYSHVVKDKIYYRLDSPPAIHYATKKESGFIKPDDNLIITDSMAVQNFRVFIDTNPETPPDEKYKAIGGYHTGKNHGLLKNCPISKESSMVHAENPCWPKEEKLVFKDDFSHPKHANGMYIFVSRNGVDWSLYHDKPVLSALTKCETSVIGSDSMPSIFYDHNIDEYVLYLRCNVKLGVRHVFYTKSKDLITWDKPKLVTKEPSFDFNHENLYFMGAYPFPNSKKYISFSHHFKNEILKSDGSRRKYYDRRTKVMVSTDGEHWKEVGNIFADDNETWKVESGETGCTNSMATHLGPPHIVSFAEQEDDYALYVLEGICTNETKIMEYLINKEDLDKVVNEN